MGPVLNGLIRLQSVENRLRAAKAKLTRCRRNVVIQENQIKSLQNALEAKKEEVQLTKVQSDRLELELKTKEERIAKLRASLNTAKTNKEYATLLTHLNTTRADTSKLETQILELLRDVEADEAECRKIQGEIEQQKQKLEQTRREAGKLADKYQSEIEEIQVEWNQVAETIPAEPLEIFRRVAETYDGQAVEVVDEQEGATGGFICGGCFMGLPAENVNMLMTKDEVIRCPNCTRILVLKSEEHS
jgi:predicted  nucleic acid-binding Zn-ribbon protein